MSSADTYLLELFREEMATSSAILTNGLLSLERQGASRESIEPLMRAAHSIKGAARVVELQAIVRIAHVMEDVLVAAGEGKVIITPEIIDTLLGALDWMMAPCALAIEAMVLWLEARTEEASQWTQKIIGCQEGEQAIAPPAPASVEKPVAQAAEAAPETPADAVSAPSDTPYETQTTTTPATSSSNDTSVKIDADTLNQILSHAADLLLEARRIEGTLRSSQPIKRLQQAAKVMLLETCQKSPERDRFEQILDELGTAIEHHDNALNRVASRTSVLTERLHNLVLRGRMRPFADGVVGFPRLVRDLSRQLGKQAELEIVGQATLMDRDVLALLDAPLNHLLRNALDHGLEMPEQRLECGKPATGRLRLAARHRSGRLVISLGDDGKGIDAEALRDRVVQKGLVEAEIAGRLSDAELYDFLFLPGFSTRDTVNEVSGRGVGLDVVQSMVHACGGSLNVGSLPGKGTRFELQLPVTRSVIRVLQVDIADQCYAFPLARIDRVERVDQSRLESLNGYYYLSGEEGNAAVISARRILGLEESPTPAGRLELIMVSSSEGRRYALEVDKLGDDGDVVVRPLDARLGKVPNLAAAALDELGQPLLILDVEDMIRSADRIFDSAQPVHGRAIKKIRQKTKRVLVVDDSITVREVERRLLENSGYQVEVAVDGVDGWNNLSSGEFDLIVSDIDMPRMNGFELISRIRNDSRFSGLPVIIVSYKDREEDRLRGMELGADYYLTKSSFNDSSLTLAVRDLIGGANET